jgi:glycine reductase
MVKAIEEQGIPAVHVCTIVPISETVGANRILPSIAIPYPTGNPTLSRSEELELRKSMMIKALNALSKNIEAQTIFS